MSVSANQVRDVVSRALTTLQAHADELRSLDAALGDGDLGITVQSGSKAVIAAWAALPAEAAVSDLLLAAGKAFSTANPSTFAALVGGGLLAAAKTVTGKTEAGKVDKADVLAIGRAVAGRIAERGKSQLGDKTVLDALVPSLDVLDAGEGEAPQLLAAMIATAHERIDATAGQQSRKGRAAWVQERSVGHPDPGATAYLRFLECLRDAW
ncbi:DAK2 domain-containing protein [Paraburkholderia kururiensis]|uniref:DAK2 domain-containing protein n=1 Tax=Paraburkholderia kururiensis TaxID=984307 RepID=UPI0003453E26|nr:DAK2 domain-containing protein [Paraburkholderia kururiensis]